MGVRMQKCPKDKISVATVQKDAFGELLVILRCLVTKDWAVPLGFLPSPGPHSGSPGWECGLWRPGRIWFRYFLAA